MSHFYYAMYTPGSDQITFGTKFLGSSIAKPWHMLTGILKPAPILKVHVLDGVTREQVATALGVPAESVSQPYLRCSHSSMMEGRPYALTVTFATTEDARTSYARAGATSLIQFEDVTMKNDDIRKTVDNVGHRVRRRENDKSRLSEGRGLNIVLRSLYGPGRANYSREELRKQLLAALPAVPNKIVFGMFCRLAVSIFIHVPMS
jgi:hypothetical protein